jgi:endonuclease/exonuclease/phosphatase family metal-dependent hydrolase
VKKFSAIILAVVLLGLGWVAFKALGPEGVNDVKAKLKDAVSKLMTTESFHQAPPANAAGDTIKVASFNIQVFGQHKLFDQRRLKVGNNQEARIVDVLVDICRHFDVIAIQEIRSAQQNVLPLFVEALNQDGSHYQFVIGPPLGRTDSTEQYAFIFDTDTIEVDPRQVYTMDDPEDLLHREPLVANFRVKGLPSDQAFTFNLVNIHTDPDEVAKELDVLDNAFYAVRDTVARDANGNSLPQEDDVVLLGDLNTDSRHMGELGQVPNLGHVIDKTTNTRGSHQYDNIVFDTKSTVEFTGRGGVFDFMREYNIKLEEAVLVSDHLPVWAEFSVFEGGRPAIASRGAAPATR